MGDSSYLIHSLSFFFCMEWAASKKVAIHTILFRPLATGNVPCAKFFSCFEVLKETGKEKGAALRGSSLNNPGLLTFPVSSVVLVGLSVLDTAKI